MIELSLGQAMILGGLWLMGVSGLLIPFLRRGVQLGYGGSFTR